MANYNVFGPDAWFETINHEDRGMDYVKEFAGYLADDELGGQDGPEEPFTVVLTVTDQESGESVTFPHEILPYPES